MLKNKITDNQRICFLGDSITASGKWIAEVYQHMVDHFPAKGLKLFNCGVGGEYTTRALNRIYMDCLNHSPDYVVVMYGMNDVGTGLYKDNIPSEEKRAAINKYRENLDEIVRLCQRNGSQVILCTPTVYDSYSVKEKVNLPYVNVALRECGAVVKTIARRENLLLIDFFDAMLPFVERGEYGLISEDRVHPSDMGYHFMAQTFLRDAGFIEAINIEEMPTLSENNRKRLEMESFIRTIMFVEWNAMYEETVEGNLTVEEKKIVSRDKFPEYEWYADTWKIYNENRDHLELKKKLLYELTVGMYI